MDKLFASFVLNSQISEIQEKKEQLDSVVSMILAKMQVLYDILNQYPDEFYIETMQYPNQFVNCINELFGKIKAEYERLKVVYNHIEEGINNNYVSVMTKLCDIFDNDNFALDYEVSDKLWEQLCNLVPVLDGLIAESNKVLEENTLKKPKKYTLI